MDILRKISVGYPDENDPDGVYTPLNGSFIHFNGEIFEVGSQDPVNDQLQGLRNVLKTGINNLFGPSFGDKVDPMVFEDGRWDHDDHEENDGKHVTFIRFNKDQLNEYQVEELENALEKLYVTEGNSETSTEASSDDNNDNENPYRRYVRDLTKIDAILSYLVENNIKIVFPFDRQPFVEFYKRFLSEISELYFNDFDNLIPCLH